MNGCRTQRRDDRSARWTAAVLVLFLLAGCGAPGPLIPDQRAGSTRDSRPAPAPQAYRVARGDTLYSIAFRYGLDWRRVAKWNAIGSPYTIHVGEWIRLRPPPDMRPAVAREASGDSSPAERSPAAAPAPRAAPESKPESEPAPESESEPEPEPEPATPRESRSPRARPAAPTGPVPDAATRSVAGIEWRWPTSGTVKRGFDAGATRKGILIAGEAGQTVRAAAAGEVVYSGSGLIGYGELVIIKHSERMLSAYAHNRERLVAEGDTVRAGQAIGRMGRNERDETVLHFEIRRDGKPDDPAGYLPRR